MANEIQKIKLGKNGVSHDVTAAGVKTNETGNREFYSEGTNKKGDPQKVNVLSVGDIQVKTGTNSVLQLDCENNTLRPGGDPAEYAIKICNGEYAKANRVVSAKINVAELIFDTQNAHETNEKSDQGSTFDHEEFKMKFRHDKKDEPIYLKQYARAFDFCCQDHGGIALQPAGQDSANHENKIKFESSRTNAITAATGTYASKGGDGLEFGTFNNLHTSLFTKDYRFNQDGYVYAVTRGAIETAASGKKDYPTQSDDFKDILDNTKRATWSQIVTVAAGNTVGNGFATREDVSVAIACAQLPGHEAELSSFATKSELAAAIADVSVAPYIAGTHINIEDKVISVVGLDASIAAVSPLAPLADNVEALDYISIGTSKGNFQIDITEAYTYEAGVNTVDEHNVAVAKGGRIKKSAITTESYYTDPSKYCYVAKKGATFADSTAATKGDIVAYGTMSSYITDTIKRTLTTSADEQYYLTDAQSDNAKWKITPLWSKNEININLESASKIKLSGAKLEALGLEDPDDAEKNLPMESFSVSATEIAIADASVIEMDASTMLFEKKITKNGDISGNTLITYFLTNNVADTSKVPDSSTFITNYKSKHPDTTLSDAQIEALYYELKNYTEPTYSVRISELLSLVGRVAALEAQVQALTQNNS